jgi:hypothetical protein
MTHERVVVLCDVTFTEYLEWRHRVSKQAVPGSFIGDLETSFQHEVSPVIVVLLLLALDDLMTEISELAGGGFGSVPDAYMTRLHTVQDKVKSIAHGLRN